MGHGFAAPLAVLGLWVACGLLALGVPISSLRAQPAPASRNVVLIVVDGLRWQEVFRGAERALMSRQPGGVGDTTALLRDFWRADGAERRRALLPFVWGTIARDGQVFGNQDRGSVAAVTNTFRFSYPGYNEILTGSPDPRIDSNGYPPNPNVTVFEWIARQPSFAGKVAAVATWNAFGRIFNRDRAGFDVIHGWAVPFSGALATRPRGALINELYRHSVRLWPDNTFDAPMHLAAKEYVRALKPRLLFVGYGETDEWAHAGRYDLLLRSANRADSLIADLWAEMQALPEYRGRTTFVITTDHGRGSGPDGWKDHGERVDGAEYTWIAVLGPDTRALGERTNVGRVTQSQLAATVAALLGLDYRTAAPGAGPALSEVLGRR